MSVSPLYKGQSVEEILKGLPLPPEYCRSLPVEGTETEGYSPIFRNKIAVNGLLSHIHPDITTLDELINFTFNTYPNNNWLAYRLYNEEEKRFDNYTHITYKQGWTILNNLASGIRYLIANHVAPGDSQIVTIYLANLHQYLLIEYGCITQALVFTCLYDSLGLKATGTILSLTESPIVFLQKDNVERILQLREHKKTGTKLKFLITIEDLNLAKDNALMVRANACGLSLIDFKSLIEIGKAHPASQVKSKPSDLATISFTSGTTGDPKGVEVRHEQIVSIASHMITCLNINVPNGKSFEFLPYGHCFQRTSNYSALFGGYCYYFPHNPRNPATYFEDIKLAKPHYICLVPRVTSKLETLFKEKISSSSYLTKIVDWKISLLSQGKSAPSFLFDRFIAPKFRSAAGFDNLIFLITGSAPISPQSILFLKAVLNIGVSQGYGLTESFCAGASSTHSTLEYLESIGGISNNIEVKLKDVPALGYSWKGNRSGEFLIRGPGLFANYYKRPDIYKECVDSEGFYGTGDIAKLDEKGSVYIVDRVKNFFKLSQGKFIASEKIQQMYSAMCPLVDQVHIQGDSLKHFLVGIIGVNIPAVSELLKQWGFKFDYKALNSAALANSVTPENVAKMDIGEKFIKLLNQKEVKSKLLTVINAKVASSNLMSYEMMKNIYFTIQPFTVENGTMTPTLKTKRADIKKMYGKIFDQLYKEGEIVTSQSKL